MTGTVEVLLGDQITTPGPIDGRVGLGVKLIPEGSQRRIELNLEAFATEIADREVHLPTVDPPPPWMKG
jgi:hypothetical protein